MCDGGILLMYGSKPEHQRVNVVLRFLRYGRKEVQRGTIFTGDVLDALFLRTGTWAGNTFKP